MWKLWILWNLKNHKFIVRIGVGVGPVMDVMDIVEPQNYKFKVRIGVGPVVEVMDIVEAQQIKVLI